MIDVRTRAEWNYVGVPDLSRLNKQPILAEWQRYPDMQVDPGFTDGVVGELERRGVGKAAPLLFLCRSGARSLAAARALTAAGFTSCFNISDGFEGPLDPDAHRNTIAGWRASGLPWRQA